MTDSKSAKPTPSTGFEAYDARPWLKYYHPDVKPDLDPLDLAHPRDDRLGVLGVVREHREVDADLRRAGCRDVESRDHSTRRLDDPRHLAHRRRPRGEDEADGHGVGDRRRGRHTEN